MSGESGICDVSIRVVSHDKLGEVEVDRRQTRQWSKLAVVDWMAGSLFDKLINQP